MKKEYYKIKKEYYKITFSYAVANSEEQYQSVKLLLKKEGADIKEWFKSQMAVGNWLDVASLPDTLFQSERGWIARKPEAVLHLINQRQVTNIYVEVVEAEEESSNA